MLFFQSYYHENAQGGSEDKWESCCLLRVKEVERTFRLSSATISGDHPNKDDGNEFIWVRFIEGKVQGYFLGLKVTLSRSCWNSNPHIRFIQLIS